MTELRVNRFKKLNRNPIYRLIVSFTTHFYVILKMVAKDESLFNAK